MIYPRKNLLVFWFFDIYIRYITKQNFSNIDFDYVDTTPHSAVLLLANHYSWWDGFTFYMLNKKLFKKKFHIMILEETVRKFSFMKYMGAFSMKKGSREMIASLDYAASLLNDPDNLVLVFPQGKLYSNFAETITFERGAYKIIEKAKQSISVVYAASFTENLQHKQPFVSIYLNLADEVDNSNSLEYAYQKFYKEAKGKHIAITV